MAYIRVDPGHDGTTKQQITPCSSRWKEYNYVVLNQRVDIKEEGYSLNTVQQKNKYDQISHTHTSL